MEQVEIMIETHNIQSQRSLRYLGVQIIDGAYVLKCHIEYVCKKVATIQSTTARRMQYTHQKSSMAL